VNTVREQTKFRFSSPPAAGARSGHPVQFEYVWGGSKFPVPAISRLKWRARDGPPARSAEHRFGAIAFGVTQQRYFPVCKKMYL